MIGGLRRGYPELIVCGFIWGSIGVLVKTAAAGGVTIVFFRLLLGAAVVIGWFAARRRLAALRLASHRGLMVAAGVTLAVHWAFLFEAFKRLDVAPTILVVYIGPVVAAAAAPAVLGERLEGRTVAALGLSMGGMALIAFPALGAFDPFGGLAALLAGATFAMLLLIGKVLTRHYPPATIVAWQLGIAALVLTPAAFTSPAGAVVESLPAMLLLGILHTGIAGLLFFRGLGAVKVQHAGILAYLEPATAVLYAWVLLAEIPAAATLAGGMLILGAGIMTVFGRQAEPVMPAPGVARGR